MTTTITRRTLTTRSTVSDSGNAPNLRGLGRMSQKSCEAWVPTTWTLSAVDVPEVLEWAAAEARERKYEVHVCSPYEDCGWTWIRLFGTSPHATYFDDGQVFEAVFPDHDQ